MLRQRLFFAFSILWATTTSAQEPARPWLDDMHDSIADSVTVTAEWFDSFFAEGPSPPDQQARGEARLRLGWEPRSRDWNEFEARLRVRVKLPKFKDRVDIILSDYDDEAPDERISAGRDGRFDRDDRFSLALRFKPKPDSGLSHRIGVGRRAQIFGKSRYRQHHQLSDVVDLQWETSLYYYNRDGWGGNIKVHTDYASDDDVIWRWANRFYYRDESDDWLWQHSWQRFAQHDADTATLVGFYIEGLSKPTYRLEEYLASVRWRKNAFRDWLFFEVEPFVLWRRDENFSASYGVALRVEGNFGHH
ncbi:hypothetical protein LJ739_13175 [Aestuariibacter halophilus]|uniref:Alginate export domain-containing protein n=1 Tax=Fluctibacter halophilus TaxID=226011 RepID=A0ABS8GBR9_9ALTE|nr:hypothetical protein [Aestuariibacter halophilus]MCC2617199.1 hypothetical protein [Aestuariibacter halophilus]